jgi:proteasome activator subunit 4
MHWRFIAIALNSLNLVLSYTQPLSIPLIQLISKLVQSEHPTTRRISVSLLNKFFIIIKKQTPKKSGAKVEQSLRSTMYASSPTSQTRFIDDGGNIGWLCWPEKAEVYDPSLVLVDAGMEVELETTRELKQLIASSAFWESILKFMAQENAQEIEQFSGSAFFLYKRAFACFGVNLLDLVQEKLASFAKDANDKSKQRASCELIAGIVRGSKHWDSASRAKMWSVVLPIFQQGVSGATSESVIYWGESIKYICVSFVS